MEYLIRFSPTGGTQRAAEALTRGLGGPARKIDLCRPGGNADLPALRPEDRCLVAVPSYGGRVPVPAAERLERLAGGGAAAVLLCAYGNRAFDDTLLELEDLLTARGFRCVAAVAAVTEHSIVRRFAAGRPDRADLAELEAFGVRIRETLTADGPVRVPGNRPYRAYAGLPLSPKAGRGCTACGVCAAACPVGAIPADAPAQVDKAACIACMRCVAVCPRQVRRANPVVLLAAEQKLKGACAGRKENQLFLPDPLT